MKEFILINQRIDKFGKHNEIRDNLDPRLLNLVIKLGLTPIILPNIIGSIDLIIKKKIKIKGIILSPGGNPKRKDIRSSLETKLINYAVKHNIALLGICRGAQTINLYYKGNIKKVKNHVRTNHNLYGSIVGKKNILVNSFHDYGICPKSFPKNLKILGISNDNYVECFAHKRKKILGIMWHPERYKKIRKFDKKILENFFN